MEFVGISKKDYELFHRLADAYYREGEDKDTSQEEVDGFIRFLFEKVVSGEIEGCFAKLGEESIGFSLWAVDTADFAFSEMPGFGTILEIGIMGSYRSSGYGKALVSFVEKRLSEKAEMCYVSAYGPAQKFWMRCGYKENGKTASNGLPIMVKTIGSL